MPGGQEEQSSLISFQSSVRRVPARVVQDNTTKAQRHQDGRFQLSRNLAEYQLTAGTSARPARKKSGKYPYEPVKFMKNQPLSEEMGNSNDRRKKSSR
jgi:hypothetical protein